MTADWTLLSLLQTTAKYLEEKGSSSARLDAELLLARVLGLDRLQLYCSYDRRVKVGELDAYRKLVKRRSEGEPVAYLLGEKEFYGLVFHVEPGVLIPRPETEHLVDRALEMIPQDARASCLDVGAGSGAIAVAIAKNRPRVTVQATDISREAIHIARGNAKKHGVNDRVEFFEGDVFAGVAGPFDLIVSNPPYIDPAQKGELARDIVEFEPHQALFAGEKGLSFIRRIVEGAPSLLSPEGAILIEIAYNQAEDAARFVSDFAGWTDPVFVKDYSGNRRVLEARLKA